MFSLYCYRNFKNRINMFRNIRQITRLQKFATIPVCTIRNTSLVSSKIHANIQAPLHTSSVAFKYDKNSSKSRDNVDSDDEGDAEFKDERDSKVVKAKVNSLRADLLLKSGLGMARNKVEVNFYESKIRVNGKKLQKKSVQLEVGDEIDVIRGFSQTNPSHLVIARVVILSAGEREDGLSVHLRRYKSMLIENYSGLNAFKTSETVTH